MGFILCYTWLGKLFTYLPVSDVAHRVNLMSAVLGAAGVALACLFNLNLDPRSSLDLTPFNS